MLNIFGRTAAAAVAASNIFQVGAAAAAAGARARPLSSRSHEHTHTQPHRASPYRCARHLPYQGRKRKRKLGGNDGDL